jgi:hypothetical protein
MEVPMRSITALRVLLYCCVAVPAMAQSTFAGVQVKGGTTLFATDHTGHETKGKLVGLTDSALMLQLKDSTRTFTPDELALIERKGDSLKNGAIVGVILGVWCAIICGQGLDSPHQLPAAVAKEVLIPIGIDAAIQGRTKIWPLKQKKTKVR